MPELKIDWCSHEAAKWAVTRWHYSETLPVGKLVRLGVWEDGAFKGVVIFSHGASPHVGDKFDCTVFEIAELTRVALKGLSCHTSRCVSIACKLFLRRSRSTRLIVSFADPEYGHHGGIYQAMGWIYTGTTSSSKMLKVGNRWLHQRVFSSSGIVKHFGRASRCHTPEGREVKIAPGKHRYLLVADPTLKLLVKSMERPYPKRAKSSGETPVVQAGEGGSTPTRALQTTSTRRS